MSSVKRRSLEFRECASQPKAHGLGRRLIEAIADWARTRGATALTLTTFSDVPWNGPYYARLGFRTLDVATLNPALQAVRRAEESAGLPMANRICMQLDLWSSMD
jgi:N-acetylglutamate synthase-like GNAT family acetyltransferase